MNPDLICLDFDGVILESNAIKDQAFEHTFSDYPQYLNAIMQYHRGVGGIIRFKKFEYIVEHILGQTYTPATQLHLAKRFSDYVLNAVSVCEFVPGALEFLNHFYSRVPLYLISVNPAQDLDWTLKTRHLHKFFKKVYATDQKMQAVKEILENEYPRAQHPVFIGDAWADYEAAAANDVLFLGRDSGHFPAVRPFEVFKDLIAVRQFLMKEK